jgi:hypothetical protein
MPQDSDNSISQHTVWAAVGGWSAEPSVKADAVLEPAVNVEEKQRADAAVAMSKRHQEPQSRQQLSFQDMVQAFYGYEIRRNGRSMQTYKQADRFIALRYILAVEKRGQKLNLGQIQSVIKRLSPAVGRLDAGQRDVYVRSLVQRIARDPKREEMQLNTDCATRIMPHDRRGTVEQGTPALWTDAVMATYHRPEVQPVKPEPPPIANEKKTYKAISAEIKGQAKRENKTLDDKSKDLEVVKELITRGHSREQIERVMSHSPHIKRMDAPDRKKGIEAICYMAQQKIKDDVAYGQREKLWQQTLNQSRER